MRAAKAAAQAVVRLLDPRFDPARVNDYLNSVCGIQGVKGCGTGFLVQGEEYGMPLCIMTNAHVIGSPQEAIQSSAMFFHTNSLFVSFDPALWFSCVSEPKRDNLPDEAHLDYCLVAVKMTPSVRARSLELRPIPFCVGAPIPVGSVIAILEFSQDRVSFGTIESGTDCFVRYNANTDPDSSCSPCLLLPPKGDPFVIALHHQRAPHQPLHQGTTMNGIFNRILSEAESQANIIVFEGELPAHLVSFVAALPEVAVIAFIGVTGSGKTTLLEFLINVLAGQESSPQAVRIARMERHKQEGEEKGSSMTKQPVTYKINYRLSGGGTKCLKLIDTPGVNDTRGRDHDEEHLKQILGVFAALESVHAVFYCLPVSVARADTSMKATLVKLFSILPVSALAHVVMCVTFSDNKAQASSAIDIVSQFFPPGAPRPTRYWLDNPWATHQNNLYYSNDEKFEEDEFGLDNRHEDAEKFVAKCAVVRNLFAKLVDREPFTPQEIKELSVLASQLNVTFAKISRQLRELSDVARAVDLLQVAANGFGGESLAQDLEAFLTDKGVALVDRKAMVKVRTNTQFPAGAKATVCFGTGCMRMSCHEDCQLTTTNQKGDEIFRRCAAMEGGGGLMHFGSRSRPAGEKADQKCAVCGCSFKYHAHSMYTLQWKEDPFWVTTYRHLKKGDALREQVAQQEAKLLAIQPDLAQSINELTEARKQFEKKSAFGNLRQVMTFQKEELEAQFQLLEDVGMQPNVRTAYKQAIDALSGCLDAMLESEEGRSSDKIHEVRTIAAQVLRKLPQKPPEVAKLFLAS